MHNHTMAKAEGTVTNTNRRAIIPRLQRQPDHVTRTDKFETIRQERLVRKKKTEAQPKHQIETDFAADKPKNEPYAGSNPLLGTTNHHQQICRSGRCNHKQNEGQEARDRPQSFGISPLPRTTTSSCS